ncbi:right-handed parallel beta-helix repeat-containing protein [Candidatus Bathyarchaeota archaeon]|nr:right-handed parallel beta-helix repeat-containing protein [Candidatus Bathyarchaeota archaeon]
MPKKKKQRKSWKERLRERKIKYQRALETHRMKLEKELQEKSKRASRRKLLLASLCFTILILSIYGAVQYTIPTSDSYEGSNQTQGQTQTNQTESSPSLYGSDAILILPDGSIYPSTAPITKSGDNYYVVEEDLTLPIKVGKDHIVIDGAGHTLKGRKIYDSRGIDLAGRKNVTVKNLKIESFDYGVYLNSTSDCTIMENEFMENYVAVWISFSSNNKVLANSIANISLSQGYGIWVKNSTGNLVDGNNVTLYSYGIYLGYSDDNVISENILKENRVGVYLYRSSDNMLSGNKLINNVDSGIHMLMASNNIIKLNQLSTNGVALSLDNSNNNLIYNNNFLNNTQQVYNNNSTNIWNGSLDEGGNYWSDYTGTDENGDGIGDTPYLIDEKNEDQYPLISEKLQ